MPYSPRLYTNTQTCNPARELLLFAPRLCATSWHLAYRDRSERASPSEHLAVRRLRSQSPCLDTTLVSSILCTSRMRLRLFHLQRVDTQGPAKRTTERSEAPLTPPTINVAATEEGCQALDRSETPTGSHMSCTSICGPAMGTATTVLSRKPAYRLDATLATPAINRRQPLTMGMI